MDNIMAGMKRTVLAHIVLVGTPEGRVRLHYEGRVMEEGRVCTLHR